MSTHTYQEAVEKLNTLQSNAAALDAVRASGGRISQFAIPEMLEYLGRIGYTPERLNDLNVIHITGTKGKGSTSAFTDSLLRHARPDWKVGLYTSPHLVAVRERIRINGVPISEETFTKYFFEIWDRLQANTTRAHESTALMPGYFRFITLLAFHVFLESRVDATVLEVGVGGTYDSTNIVPKPTVTGITALGIDHTAVLGKTIEEIAWQKGGIYKPGVPAFTVEQPESPLKVLQGRAQELKASSFNVVKRTAELDTINLGLAGAHQVENANLALTLAKTFITERTGRKFDDGPIPEDLVRGLTEARWPGRCQQVADPRRKNTTWYLDGAHTLESLKCCFNWFASTGVAIPDSRPEANGRPVRVLVFNITRGRQAEAFLRASLETIEAQLAFIPVNTDKVETFFDRVIFCTNITYTDGHFKGDLTTVAMTDDDLHLKSQRELATEWSKILPQFPTSNIFVLPSVEHAIQNIDSIQKNPSQPTQVLVSGSLHLVGGVIEVANLKDVAL